MTAPSIFALSLLICGGNSAAAEDANSSGGAVLARAAHGAVTPSQGSLAPESALAPSADPPLRPPKKQFFVSLAALTAANIADTASSMGKRELNPLLACSRGNFTAASAARKMTLVGGLETMELYLFHRNAHVSKALTILNFAGAAVVSGVAARNFRLH